MPLAAHIAAKDLRRFWPWIVGYLGMLSVHAFLLMQDPLLEESIYSPLPRMLLTVLAVALTARAIQQEPPIGTTAWWLTRPIPASSLLFGKALWLVPLVILLPASVDIAGLLRFGLPSGKIGYALGASLLEHGYMLVGAAALAAISTNLPTFAVVLIGGLYLGSVLVGSTRAWIGSDIAEIDRTLLSHLVLLFFGTVVAANQYLSRNLRRSLLLAGAGLMGALLLGALWSWPIVANDTEATTSGSSHSTSEVVFLTAPQGFSYSVNERGPMRKIYGALAVTGEKPGLSYQLNIRGALELPSGQRFEHQAATGPLGFGLPERMHGFERPWGGTEKSEWLSLLLEVSPADYQRYRNEAGVYEADVRATAYRWVITQRFPPAGESWARSPGQVTYVRTATLSDDYTVFVRQRRLERGTYRRLVRVWLANFNARQFMDAPTSATGPYSSRSFPGGYRVTASDFEFRFPISHPAGRAPDGKLRWSRTVGDTWVDGAEIVYTERRYAGEFTHKIRVRNFRMADYTIDAWRARMGRKD